MLTDVHLEMGHPGHVEQGLQAQHVFIAHLDPRRHVLHMPWKLSLVGDDDTLNWKWELGQDKLLPQRRFLDAVDDEENLQRPVVVLLSETPHEEVLQLSEVQLQAGRLLLL